MPEAFYKTLTTKYILAWTCFENVSKTTFSSANTILAVNTKCNLIYNNDFYISENVLKVRIDRDQK